MEMKLAGILAHVQAIPTTVVTRITNSNVVYLLVISSFLNAKTDMGMDGMMATSKWMVRGTARISSKEK